MSVDRLQNRLLCLKLVEIRDKNSPHSPMLVKTISCSRSVSFTSFTHFKQVSSGRSLCQIDWRGRKSLRAENSVGRWSRATSQIIKQNKKWSQLRGKIAAETSRTSARNVIIILHHVHSWQEFVWWCVNQQSSVFEDEFSGSSSPSRRAYSPVSPVYVC